MPTYCFWTRGTLLSKWPGELQIDLLSCQFSKGTKEYEFVVYTLIDARDDIEAKENGLEKCIEATNFLGFLLNQDISLNYRERNIRRKNGGQKTSIGLTLTILSNEELPADKLSIIRQVQDSLKTLRPKDVVIITRAVNWFIGAKRDKVALADKYISFWIALEVLVQGVGNNVHPKIKKRLFKLYPSANLITMGKTIGRLYSLRKEIVHYGKKQPRGISDRTRDIENICEDLVRDDLGLEFLAKSKHIFFSEVKE